MAAGPRGNTLRSRSARQVWGAAASRLTMPAVLSARQARMTVLVVDTARLNALRAPRAASRTRAKVWCWEVS